MPSPHAPRRRPARFRFPAVAALWACVAGGVAGCQGGGGQPDPGDGGTAASDGGDASTGPDGITSPPGPDARSDGGGRTDPDAGGPGPVEPGSDAGRSDGGPGEPPPAPDPCGGQTAACPPASLDGFGEGDGLVSLDRCAFGLGDADLAENGALVEALAARLTPVPLAQVVGDGNRTATRLTSLAGVSSFRSGFTWQSGDTTVTYWIPQGITGSGDGDPSGMVGGREVVVVSWYFDPERSPDDPRERGVRLSFADVTDPANVTYRHALLVVPSGTVEAPDFGAVNVHAGGIAWVGRYLYVADTSQGFRVFDLERILQVPSADGLGLDEGTGTYAAFGYKYVIPQVGRHRLQETSCAARFSFVALDRTSSPPSLITGEYISNSVFGRLFRWPLDPASGRPAVTEGVLRPAEVFFAGQTRVQGALAIDGSFFLSCSSQNGTPEGSFYRAESGTASAEFSWPRGPEDLYHHPGTGAIWSLTEHAPDRHVFSVPAASYQR